MITAGALKKFLTGDDLDFRIELKELVLNNARVQGVIAEGVRFHKLALTDESIDEEPLFISDRFTKGLLGPRSFIGQHLQRIDLSELDPGQQRQLVTALKQFVDDWLIPRYDVGAEFKAKLILREQSNIINLVIGGIEARLENSAAQEAGPVAVPQLFQQADAAGVDAVGQERAMVDAAGAPEM
ncbi:hypothetical protein AVI51_06170 [Piscirickettsia salmonis]|uniref:Uncharacterized protein n=1 Tax=Piscirickettsia salmonis TaxID=1238 RepID=A0A9Q5VAM1_PISSA|nr:hypothetical protein [Piscirickettsia salmonis]ALA25677.1 hypothetical protein KW89_2211 [Piscirickettsia salmonis]APS43168.1 hypothetical protein AVI48_01390 [Piscirickettsia salmonis]APS46516.1 hypothetical protein AVI49_01990 [Piscirickettsia salmonis]APS50486.1 hypothetical protein AVI50_06235 [Piscirickettsia salmonis]APS53689.1 hypothetical protein AVI51_06170 [Piscirickettsia salmonis]